MRMSARRRRLSFSSNVNSMRSPSRSRSRPMLSLEKLHEEPLRPRDGMVVYADGSNWDPGSGEGIYAYVAGAWVPAGVATTAAFSASGSSQTGITSGAYTQILFTTVDYRFGSHLRRTRGRPRPAFVTLTHAFFCTGTINNTCVSDAWIYKMGLSGGGVFCPHLR